MKRIILIGMMVLVTSLVFAEGAVRFNFQGLLRDSTGNPVADGNYFVTFRIYSDSVGGTAKWVESHPAMAIRNGLLNAELGRLNPCTLAVFDADSAYLEVQVGFGPIPSSTRMKIGATPRSGTSKRVKGDIETFPGLIRLFDPQPETPGYQAFLEMNSLDGITKIKLFDPQPEPPGTDPLILMSAGSSQSSIKMFDPQPEPPGITPLIEINTESGIGTIKMFDPQPEPPGSANIEISSNGSARFFTAGTEYMGVEPSPFNNGGLLTMYGGVGSGPSVVLSSEGKISVGTGAQTNIITVQQSSATDPIADAWTVYSSRRWKTNIAPISHGLDKVMALQGVTFDWKDSGKHDIGLIAEDVGMVIPEVVAYEENGKDAKSVDYARLVAVLIEAVKEQQGIIRGLETDINQLQNQYESLSNELVNIRKMKSETTAEPKH
jgi:hypothetical protein